MIDFIKLQIELLKIINKEKTVKHIAACIDDLDVLYTPDGLRAYRIPLNHFYIDANKIRVFEGLKNIMNTERGEEVQLTQELRLSKNGKDKLLTFVFENGKRAYINEKHINTIIPKITEKHYYHFYMKDYNSCLKIFEDNVCIAVFMPVVFKDQKE